MRTKVQDYFIRFIEQVSERKFLLYWFTKIKQYPSLNKTFNDEDMTMKVPGTVLPGEIYERTVGKDNEMFIVVDVTGNVIKLEVLGKNLNRPLLAIRNDIELRPNEVKSFKGPKPIITSPGIIILNQRIFVESIGEVVPFKEDAFSPAQLDAIIPPLLLSKQIVNDQVHALQTNAYDLGFFGELCNKGFTPKTWTTDPRIPKLKKEKIAKLSPEDRKDPIVLSKLEDELLAIDREWVRGDDTEIFHEHAGGKSFAIHRKKMLIAVGAIPSFTDKGEAEFTLVETSLGEGLDKKNFASYVNEIYKASYDRGTETAKGGELTKYVLRVFQDLKITSQDCGTKEGIPIELVKSPISRQNTAYIGRYMLDGSIVTQEIINKNAGKIITIRDPMRCKNEKGLCYRCMGHNFEVILETAIGTYILDVSSGIMMIAMKNMHGTKLKTLDVVLDDYLLTV